MFVVLFLFANTMWFNSNNIDGRFNDCKSRHESAMLDNLTFSSPSPQNVRNQSIMCHEEIDRSYTAAKLVL